MTPAEALATEAHAGQMYGARSYVDHCRDVVRVLAEHGYTSRLYADAGWLHDLIEDTALTTADIERACGPHVAALVSACTGIGRSRAERNRIIYAQLREEPAAVPVKVADRIANVEECWRARDRRLFMYRDEHAEFRSVVAPHVTPEMLARLDRLVGWSAKS